MPERNLVLALVAENENQALRGSSEAIGLDLIGRGYRHQVIDMFVPSGTEELLTLLRSGQVAFVYSFAGVGSRFTLTTGANVWTATRTPFICLWYDHPAYNYHQHMVDSPYVAHIYHVRDHLEARQKFLPGGGARCFLAPLWLGTAPHHQRRPFRDRQRAIFFVKTGQNPALMSDPWKDHPVRVQDVLWALVQQAQGDRNLNLTAATADILTRYGESPDNLDLFMGIVAEVDRYIRAWRSDRLARALLSHPSVIVGRGWDYLMPHATRAVFEPPITFERYIERTSEYKIMANSNPLWRDGIHERAILGIHYGCLALTDRTEKSDVMFADMKNYIAFDWHDNLDDVIAESLAKADDDDVDYIAHAEKLLAQRGPKGAEYLDCIVGAVREIYDQAS